MPDWSSWLAFVVASVALILLPGPGQALTIAQTLGRGFRAGALTAIGLNVGTLCHAMAAGLGLSAILTTSALAYSVVKYIGAAYLLFLGVAMLRKRPGSRRSPEPGTPSPRGPFVQAVLAGVLNPKVALFFMAFLPQFVDPAKGHLPAQFFVLGLTMAILDTGYECLLAWLVWRAKGRFAASPWLQRLQARVTGTVLVLLGLRLAIDER